MPVSLLGIDPPRYRRIIALEEAIVAGAFRLQAHDALIGRQLAADLGLRVGDKLRLDAGQGQESVVSVAGIFQLGVRRAGYALRLSGHAASPVAAEPARCRHQPGLEAAPHL